MEYFNSVRSFNPMTKEWKEKAPMNAKRFKYERERERGRERERERMDVYLLGALFVLAYSVVIFSTFRALNCQCCATPTAISRLYIHEYTVLGVLVYHTTII